MPAKKTSSNKSQGLKHFSFHAAFDGGPALAAILETSVRRLVVPAGAGQDPVAALDPASAAKMHLDQMLASGKFKELTLAKDQERVVDFKLLDSQAIPFTNTTIVKFREFVDQIPIFGSFIAVEVDDKNALVAVDSAITEIASLPDALAKVSQAEVANKVRSEAKLKRATSVNTPRLYYYFDEKRSSWKLAYIVENSPAPADQRSPARGARTEAPPAPVRRSDYVIDALNGKLIQAVPRNFGARRTGAWPDELDAQRTIGYDQAASPKLARLIDEDKKISTHDDKFHDVDLDSSPLPGSVISDKKDPPQWSKAAVSAHANAGVVLEFLRTVLLRNSIDGQGMELISSINCISSSDPVPGDPKGWINAFWNGQQMAYGQVNINNAKGVYRSLAAAQDIVGHEMFHGVTEHTSDLAYKSQSGALNESYSDIFGVLINNWGDGKWASANRKADWDWLIGKKALPGGKPFRSMEDPAADPALDANSRQPKLFKDYIQLPETRNGDMGGVHINSGIPNYCAFLILTALDATGKQAFTADECAQLFYVTVTARLNRTADFAANKMALANSARSLFRNDLDGGVARLATVTEACTNVGL